MLADTHTSAYYSNEFCLTMKTLQSFQFSGPTALSVLEYQSVPTSSFHQVLLEKVTWLLSPHLGLAGRVPRPSLRDQYIWVFVRVGDFPLESPKTCYQIIVASETKRNGIVRGQEGQLQHSMLSAKPSCLGTDGDIG